MNVSIQEFADQHGRYILSGDISRLSLRYRKSLHSNMSLFLRSVLLASGLLVAAQNGPKCPDSNGQSYTAASGAVFRVECDIDHQGGDIASTSANSLGECIAACDSTPGCVDVSLSGVVSKQILRCISSKPLI